MTGNAGITRIPKEIIQSIAPNRVIFSATAPVITEDMELDTVWINTDNMYEYNIFPVPNITTKTGYGALYSWWATQQELITGFTVPTDEQQLAQRNHLGGGFVSGGKLKSTRTDPTIPPSWITNTGATDEVNFSGVPAGRRFLAFENITFTVYFWSSTQSSSTHAYYRMLSYNNAFNSGGSVQKKYGMSIRCVRPLTVAEQTLSDGSYLTQVQDYDGNWYEVVKIGNLAWTAQNLRTTHYADGTPIPNVTDQTEWNNLTTGAYCWYDNNPEIAGIIYTDENIILQEGGHKFWAQLGIYSEQI